MKEKKDKPRRATKEERVYARRSGARSQAKGGMVTDVFNKETEGRKNSGSSKMVERRKDNSPTFQGQTTEGTKQKNEAFYNETRIGQRIMKKAERNKTGSTPDTTSWKPGSGRPPKAPTHKEKPAPTLKVGVVKFGNKAGSLVGTSNRAPRGMGNNTSARPDKPIAKPGYARTTVTKKNGNTVTKSIRIPKR